MVLLVLMKGTSMAFIRFIMFSISSVWFSRRNIVLTYQNIEALNEKHEKYIKIDMLSLFHDEISKMIFTNNVS